MGGTTLYDRPDDPLKYLARNLTWESENYRCAPLAIRNVGSTYYAAVKMQPKPNLALSDNMISGYTPQHDGSIVFAAIYLTSIDKGEFSYKDMTEDMGPGEAKAPPLILNLLSPTTNEYASQWRTSCRAWANRLKPRTGDKIRIQTPWEPYGTDFEKIQYYRRKGVYRSLKTKDLVRLRTADVAGATLIS